MAKQGHEPAVAISDINVEEGGDKESGFGVPELNVQAESDDKDSFQHIAKPPDQEPSTQDQSCG